MELTTKEVNEVIDKVLPLLKDDSSRQNFEMMMIKRIQEINPYAVNQLVRINRIMVSKNLILLMGKDTRHLTEFGKQVLDNGGWLKHVEELEEDSRIEKQTKRLTLEVLKKEFIQVKYWWVILLATALFSALFSWLFTLIPNE